MVTRVHYVHCPDCQTFTQTSWGTHYCLRKLGPGETRTRMDYQIKKWNHVLQCWVLDSSRTITAPHGRFWDAKAGQWVEDPAFKETQKTLTGQIADIGAEKGKKIEEIPSPKESSITYKGPTYIQSRPWDGVDKNRFPNTFMRLVQLYYAKDWYSVGPYISDDTYRDRVLRGIYAPEPKNQGMYPNYNGVGHHWRRDEWE